MNNLKRLKKLVLANKETRRLYRMMQFLAIFMVISCTIIIVVAKWIEHDQNQKREELFGSWDEVFLDVPAEDLNYFKQNAFLEQISIQSIQEKVFLEGDKRVVIGSCDDNFLEMGNIELLEGRMPEKENEVAVEEEYLEILGVSKKGDFISSNSKIKSLQDYEVVGIIKNYSGKWKLVNKSSKLINCFTYNATKNEINVYVTYKNYKNYDLEINMLNYKRNISKEKILTLPKILSYIVSGLSLVVIISIILILAIYMNKILKIRVKNRERNKMLKNILLIVSIIFEILFSYNITETVSGIIIQPIKIKCININEDVFYKIHDTEDSHIVSIYLDNNLSSLFHTRINTTYFLVCAVNELTNIMVILNLAIIQLIIYSQRLRISMDEDKYYFMIERYFWCKDKQKMKIKPSTIRMFLIMIFSGTIFNMDNIIKNNYSLHYAIINEFIILLILLIIIVSLKIYKNKILINELHKPF